MLCSWGSRGDVAGGATSVGPTSAIGCTYPPNDQTPHGFPLPGPCRLIPRADITSRAYLRVRVSMRAHRGPSRSDHTGPAPRDEGQVSAVCSENPLPHRFGSQRRLRGHEGVGESTPTFRGATPRRSWGRRRPRTATRSSKARHTSARSWPELGWFGTDPSRGSSGPDRPGSRGVTRLSRLSECWTMEVTIDGNGGVADAGASGPATTTGPLDAGESPFASRRWVAGSGGNAAPPRIRLGKPFQRLAKGDSPADVNRDLYAKPAASVQPNSLEARIPRARQGWQPAGGIQLDEAPTRVGSGRRGGHR
jgi:hypothetical protein